MLQEQQTEAGTQSQISQSTAQPAKPSLKTKGSDLAREILSMKPRRGGQSGTANGTASKKGPSRFARLPFVSNPNVTTSSNTSQPAAGYAAGTGAYSAPEIAHADSSLPSRAAPDAGPGILSPNSGGNFVMSPGLIEGSSAALSSPPTVTSQYVDSTSVEGTTLVTTETTTRIDGPQIDALDVVPLASDRISRPKR